MDISATSRSNPTHKITKYETGNTMRKLTLGFLAFAVACVAGAIPAMAQDTLKLAVPQRGAWDTAVAELGQRGGIFKKHGLTLDILYTQGGPESIQAVISGSIDIAMASGVSATIGIYSKGGPIRIIGSEMIGSPDLYWYVKPESAIRKAADFNGKTVGYSQAGSSSHAGLLELLRQDDIKATPVAVGGLAATLPQAMSGQIDVGWAAAPFGLDLVETGKIRIVARGTDVTALRGRTARVNVTGLPMMAKPAVLQRFMQAYRETVEWMYADPAALKYYGEYSGLPESVVRTIRGFIPKETMAPDRIMELDNIMADAVRQKFLAASLTPAQVSELVQIPKP
jgi:NitT/TauT family transport system substrate-binding protein